MAYPGDSSLDPTVQQRVLTAFAEAVRLHREGRSEEARSIIRSITEVDPRFTPAARLEQAIAAGAQVDLTQLVGEVAIPTGMDVEGTVVRAHQAFAQRDFQTALTLAQQVLREQPGHPDARHLALEAEGRQRATGELHAHIAHIREALEAGLAEEARTYLRLVKAIDPNNAEAAELEGRLQLAAKPLAVEADAEFEFEVFDGAAQTAVTGEQPIAAPPARPASPPPAQRLMVDRPFQPVAPPPSAPSGPPQTAVGPPPAPPAAPPPPPPPAPAPRAAPEVAPPRPGGIEFEAAPGAQAMDFHPGVEFELGGPGEAEPEDASTRIQALLDQGQQDFGRGDFQAAIDTWSRIYLIDAQHKEAEQRIEQARHRREEVERLAEHKFHDAREAFENGNPDEARKLCEEVLKLQPQHLEAHDLLQRLATPEAPPPRPAPAPAGGEEDLFRDDFVPAGIKRAAGAMPAPSPDDAPAPLPRAAERAAPLRKVGLPSIPPLWIAVGVGALLVVIVVGFLLRGKVFSGGGSAVTEALAESEELAKQGRLQEAIQLLQSLQGQAEGEQANRVNQRVLEYQRRLKVKTAPPPVPESKVVADAVAAGNRIKAMRMIRDGLARLPGDPEMLKLQFEIASYSPVIATLADAANGKNWENIRNLTEQVLKEHPDDAEARRMWSVATFNAAVLHLRKYQVAEGHDLLVQLSKHTQDPEVERLRELANSYLSRPSDPRYQIFVTNTELRALD
jgi:tetratricopeptide (TPR) repeat protein